MAGGWNVFSMVGLILVVGNRRCVSEMEVLKKRFAELPGNWKCTA